MDNPLLAFGYFGFIGGTACMMIWHFIIHFLLLFCFCVCGEDTRMVARLRGVGFEFFVGV